MSCNNGFNEQEAIENLNRCNDAILRKLQEEMCEPKDNINPSHYKQGGIETFDYIKAKLTKEQLEGYLTGNMQKYLSRYQYKNGVEDIRKMMWYGSELIKLLEERK